MYGNRAQDEEEDDWLDGQSQYVIRRLWWIWYFFWKMVASEGGDEDGSDTHGREMAREDGFSKGLDIWDPAPESKDDRKAAEQNDCDCENKETPYVDVAASAVCEFPPWHDGADVDESGNVEEQIDDVGEVRVFRLASKPSVPSKCRSAGKGCEQVITAQEDIDAHGCDC